MTCLDLRQSEMLTRYFDGTLDQAARADLERHVDGCAACRGYVGLHTRLTCREVIEDYLEQYVAGALGPDAVADLERHLQICPACVAYLNTYRRTRDLVSSVARVEMPEELVRSMEAFLLERLGLR